MDTLIADLESKVQAISEGGGAEARARHTGKGKLLVRQRINTLLDTGSPFLEFSQMAGYKLYKEEVNAGGIITGLYFLKPRILLRLELLYYCCVVVSTNTADVSFKTDPNLY